MFQDFGTDYQIKFRFIKFLEYIVNYENVPKIVGTHSVIN